MLCGNSPTREEWMPDLSAHEAIYSLRAMRRLKPDAVPEEDLRYLVDAATQAPSASNSQDWAFVVVTDPDQRRRLGELYRSIGREVIRDRILPSGTLSDQAERVYRGAMILVEHLGEAPALIVVALRGTPPASAAEGSAWYGSIYPAIQNLMLAARTRGLGTTLTTLHKIREDDVKAILGIPDGFETIALIPVGYPQGRWGRPLRTPSSAVTHWDRWNGRGPAAPRRHDPD
jgi:nitroreductase